MKKHLLTSIILISLFPLFAQNKSLTAKAVIDAASKKSSVSETVSYLKKNADSVSVNAEKRAVYAFLAAILEQQGQYAKAQETYAKAAGIQGSASSVVSGVPNKNSEELVIDAVRCALCAGDYVAADSYLHSAVRNSKDEKIQAYIKLYEQWSLLCKAATANDTKESISALRNYASLDSMRSVRPSVLLTLWHLTGESQFSENLKKNYPKSMETAIVKGEIQTLPTPFWYFVPRNGVDLPEIANIATETSSPASSASPATTSPSGAASAPKSAEKKEKVVKLQLGLFREEANARNLAERVSSKGFKAEIASEVRPSGTKYYIVVVNENATGTMGDELRTAGFDCYPLFE